MTVYYAGPEGSNIAQAEKQWGGENSVRYNNPEFDALFEQAQTETDLEAAAQLFIQMNDILINEVVVVPLVNRAADKYAMANTLIHGGEGLDVQDNVGLSPYEGNYWNIANWNRSAAAE